MSRGRIIQTTDVRGLALFTQHPGFQHPDLQDPDLQDPDIRPRRQIAVRQHEREKGTVMLTVPFSLPPRLHR